MRRTPVVLLAGLIVIVSASLGPSAPAATGAVHFTAVGDLNSTANTSAVLNGIAAAAPDFSVALGDLSYGTTGQEQTWCDFVTARVGAGYPFELVSGNHESNGDNGNINDFASCLPNQLPGVIGTYGRQYYADYPKSDPLVRMIAISPALTFPDGTYAYTAGSARYNWTAAAIDSARAAGIPWVVVAMHKPCLSVGNYTCEPGPDLVNMLLTKKVDLVLSGHEHWYGRTKQIGLGTGCTQLAIGSYDADCVKDGDNDLAQGAGTVFGTVGTGGTALRDINFSDTELPYFATTSGLNANPTWGFLSVAADADSLTGTFTRASGGDYSDSFVIHRGAPLPNEPPTASFTSGSSGLTATFNAAASSDTDGTITGYAWTFGDGTTGSGVSPSHPYATAGTYPVTLTVTDDDGATASTNGQVTVTAPTGPTVLASDDYTRTLTSGWGTAPTGGAWTTSSGASVASGVGRIALPAAGSTPAAYLPSVSSSATDLFVETSLDKVPVGGTTGAIVSVVPRRVAGQGTYFAKVYVNPNASVRLQLFRTAANGAETALLAVAIVNGITYTPGLKLSVRAQVVQQGTSALVRAKVWPTGTSEPSAWRQSVSDSTVGLQAAGDIGVKAYLSSTSTNAPIVASFDNLQATVVP